MSAFPISPYPTQMASSSKRARTLPPVKTRDASKPKLPPVDIKTHRLIVQLADGVVTAAEKRRDPQLSIPTRSLSNVRFNKSRKIIEMGTQTNCRQLFNLSQAKSYMQTLLVATGCKALIDQQKTTSIRGSLLPSQTHDRWHARRDLRHARGVRPDYRRSGGHAGEPPRRTPRLR